MNFDTITKSNFTTHLLRWHRKTNNRQMPWKGEKDPYKIWLSEVILQQTRVAQGLRYYERFIDAYPTLQHLGDANEDEVLLLWEGLGYYSRCRNLLATARYISSELGGIFPRNYNEILKLKGIGTYTAAAIASFAYDLPYAVVDGNVFRVLSRVFDIDQPIDTQGGKALFTKLAGELLAVNEPGNYNQAIMDFGATICKPKAPLCVQCPFNSFCSGFIHARIDELPVKGKKIKITKRWFYYLVMEYEDKLFIKKREEKDIWKGLYEFLLVEKNRETKAEKMVEIAMKDMEIDNRDYSIGQISPLIKQQLSHQKIAGKFIRVSLSKLPEGYGDVMIPRDTLRTYAFPGFITSYLNNYYE